MKKLNYKMLITALLLIVVSMSVSAQMGRYGVCQNTAVRIVEEGTCLVDLTDEQQVVIDDIRVEFQADMGELRTAMWSAATFADKLVIRQKMTDLRNAHIAEVQALLEEWGLK